MKNIIAIALLLIATSAAAQTQDQRGGENDPPIEDSTSIGIFYSRPCQPQNVYWYDKQTNSLRCDGDFALPAAAEGSTAQADDNTPQLQGFAQFKCVGGLWFSQANKSYCFDPGVVVNN